MANSAAKARETNNNVAAAAKVKPTPKTANARHYWSLVEALAGVVTALIIGAIVVRKTPLSLPSLIQS